MKNDLNATAVVSGYTDNTGTDKSNEELGMKRAQAAKEYLVTRHGIDPGRISTDLEGIRGARVRQLHHRGKDQEPPGRDCGYTRLGNVRRRAPQSIFEPPPPEGVF